MIDPVTQDMVLTEWTPSRIRKLTANNGAVSTLAGTGSAGYADGTGTAAAFSNLGSIVYDSSTDAYLVCDSSNHRIRRVTRAGVVTTVAGSGTATRTDGSGTSASFNQPRYMGVAPGPVFYITEWAGCSIRKMTPNGVVTTIAVPTCQGGGGIYGVVWRPADSKLYVANSGSCTIQSVTLGGTVTTVAGESGSCTYATGSLTAARFQSPHGMDLGPRGQLVVADRNNNVVREIDLDAGTVTTLAGAPNPAAYLDGTGSAARLYLPMDVRIAQHGGYILSTDFSLGTVRKIT